MWSEELYRQENGVVCPVCVNIYYRTRVLGGNLYKKCDECGRISRVTEEDDLVLVEDSE